MFGYYADNFMSSDTELSFALRELRFMTSSSEVILLLS